MLNTLLASHGFILESGGIINEFAFEISFVALQVFNKPFKIAKNGHLLVCIDDWPVEGFPASSDDWPCEGKMMQSYVMNAYHQSPLKKH